MADTTQARTWITPGRVRVAAGGAAVALIALFVFRHAGFGWIGSPSPTEADRVWSTVRLAPALTQVGALGRSDDPDSTSVHGYYVGAAGLRRNAERLVQAPSINWTRPGPRRAVAGERALARGNVVGKRDCGFSIFGVQPNTDFGWRTDLSATQTKQIRARQLALFDVIFLCTK